VGEHRGRDFRGWRARTGWWMSRGRDGGDCGRCGVGESDAEAEHAALWTSTLQAYRVVEIEIKDEDGQA
jgi:hypothetical protein